MFENFTMLTSDYLKNYFALDKDFPSQKYVDYYFNICEVVFDNHYAKPTVQQIEQFITEGYFELDGENKIVSPIEDKEMRKHLFLAAQAKQLQYDMLSGRGAILRGEDNKFNVCPDTLGRLKSLGLYQRKMLTL